MFTLARLDAHRRRQDEFQSQFGPDHRNDLDLVFAKGDGSLFKPDSIFATASVLCKRLEIRKPKGGSPHLPAVQHLGTAKPENWKEFVQ